VKNRKGDARRGAKCYGARVKKMIAFCAALVAFAGSAGPALSFEGEAFGRNGLWRVVHNICSPVSRLTGLAAPCLAVDHERGFATLRAPDEDTHIIITPLVRVAGVESPSLLGRDAPNYWADAWRERHWVEEAAGRPLAWNDIGMAINSRDGRSQDQLHIHVDCVEPWLKRAIARAARGRSGWFEMDLRPWSGRYHARRLSAEDVNRNLFRMVAMEIPGVRDNMADQTIAVIGLGEPRAGQGFLLLVADDGSHAENLLDHKCRTAKNSPHD
jgi:CDP-diacylglycerol pyrophosphatase